MEYMHQQARNQDHVGPCHLCASPTLPTDYCFSQKKGTAAVLWCAVRINKDKSTFASLYCVSLGLISWLACLKQLRINDPENQRLKLSLEHQKGVAPRMTSSHCLFLFFLFLCALFCPSPSGRHSFVSVLLAAGCMGAVFSSSRAVRRGRLGAVAVITRC